MAEYLVDRLRRYAEERPHDDAVTHVRVNAGRPEADTLDLATLDARARACATRLRRHCAPGDRVLLLHPTGLDFVVTLLGCLYSGVIAVPAPPPGDNGRRGHRTDGIVRDAQPRLALTVAPRLDDLRATLGDSVTCLATDTEAFTGTPGDPGGAPWTPEPVTAGTVAFLQYTSGSTSDPKGVLVTHGSLSDNALFMARAFHADATTRCCSWLPLYHDMGLVGMLLAPLHAGGSTVLLSPDDFLRRPQLWPRLMSEHRATITAAPDFAYDLAARRTTPEAAAALDLSRLGVCINGAEPVRATTLTAFHDRFAPAGLPATALKPCYGMAEATLMITATTLPRPAVTTPADPGHLEQRLLTPPPAGTGGQVLVASGRPDGSDVRAVDPDTRATLPPGRIGEIWVRGAGLAAGYWNRPEQTGRIFGATTAEGDTGFLRTGDLGTTGPDGDLYVTGRLKDVLVIHGRNLHPHDIERHVAALHPGFDGLQGSVCSVLTEPADQEDIVVMQELRLSRAPGADLAELARSVQEDLAASLGVRLPTVVLLRPGQVHRTTSGKVRRSLMRELFLDGELTPLHAELSPAVQRRYRTLTGEPA